MGAYKVPKRGLSELEVLFLDRFGNILLSKYTKEKLEDTLIEPFNKMIFPFFKYRKKFFLNPPEEVKGYVSKFTDSSGITNKEKVNQEILDLLFGIGPLTVLMRDPKVEEIMVNKPGENTFVFHKDHGYLKTDMKLSETEIANIIKSTAFMFGRLVDEDNLCLDTRLSKYARLNATMPPVSPLGPTITIRQFSRTPLTILDLINAGTLSTELAGMLWVLVEGLGSAPQNIIVSGGTASGKTTTLNSLSYFIPHTERIVTVEDTLELYLGAHENWVQLEAKPAYSGHPEVTMDDLIKNTLRMRPDRILVGEIRGKEAGSLFFAMNTGHAGCMGTLHANSSRETLMRLESEPMLVPKMLLSVLDIIVMQQKVNVPGKGAARRITQVTEIGGIEGEKVLLGDLFTWDPATDSLKKTEVPSAVIERLASSVGVSKATVESEILKRTEILQSMIQKDIRNPEDVERVIQAYYNKKAT